MFDLAAIQAALAEAQLDAWLLHDFRGSNVLARRILELDDQVPGSRRLYYLIPAQGEPLKLVHRIESGALDHLPGRKLVYLAWQELEARLAEIVAGCRRVALEYSPRNANPYLSKTDAGTVELLREFGLELVSSGDLVQRFEARWDDEQWNLHCEAARHTATAFERAFATIAQKVRAAGSIRETQVQQVIMDHFCGHGLTTYHPPIVAAGPHSGDPHFETSAAHDTAIGVGDFVLVDLWAKCDQPRAVYSDLTWVGFVGETVPEKYERVFAVVAQARDAALSTVRQAFASGRPLAGWEVDRAARQVIDEAGFGQYFVHRTGHSIGQETHGNGANMDDLETHELRRVLPRTCFSIEPGIYLPDFGIRSEINVYIAADGLVHVTGPEPQTRVLPILAQY